MKIVVGLIIISLIVTNIFWAVQMKHQKEVLLQIIASSHAKLLNAMNPEGEAIGTAPLSDVSSGKGNVVVGTSPLSWIPSNYTGNIVVHKCPVSMGVE